MCFLAALLVLIFFAHLAEVDGQNSASERSNEWHLVKNSTDKNRKHLHNSKRIAWKCRGENEGCCTPETPCGEGEGDCDSDADCLLPYVCGRDNCPEEYGPGDDCCRRFAPEKGRCEGEDSGCCTPRYGMGLMAMTCFIFFFTFGRTLLFSIRFEQTKTTFTTTDT